MKQFTVLLAALGVLVFSAFFQAWSESRVEAKKARALGFQLTGLSEKLKAKGKWDE